MKNLYYTMRYPITNKYQIEALLGDDSEISEDVADALFMKGLRKVCFDSYGAKAEIDAFLNYQMQQTQLSRERFVEHLAMIFPNFSYTLKPYNLAVGVVEDWIKKHNQVGNLSKEPKTAKVRKDPAFAEIISQKQTVDDILQNFKNKGIIDADCRWTVEKNKLVAFINFLLDNKLIKRLKNAELGRIFCAEFKVTMQPRAFGQTPKNPTMDWIASQAGILKFD
jgi:hypothetical protein